MNDLIKRIDRNDVIYLSLMTIICVAFVAGLYGNQFGVSVFEKSWIAIPTYMGIDKVKSNDNEQKRGH